MSFNATVVLIGVDIPGSGLLREGRPDARSGQWTLPATRRGRSDQAATQTERRFDLVDLDPFTYDTSREITAWIEHLAGTEAQLRLFGAREGMLTDGDMPEYLFRRTRGIVGLLRRLIQDGCTRAMETGREELTIPCWTRSPSTSATSPTETPGRRGSLSPRQTRRQAPPKAAQHRLRQQDHRNVKRRRMPGLRPLPRSLAPFQDEASPASSYGLPTTTPPALPRSSVTPG